MGCCRAVQEPIQSSVLGAHWSHSAVHHSHNLGFPCSCNFPQCFILLLPLHQLSLLYLKFKCLRKELFHSDLESLITSSSTDQPTSKYPRVKSSSQSINYDHGRGWEGSGSTEMAKSKELSRATFVRKKHPQMCKLLRASLSFKSIVVSNYTNTKWYILCQLQTRFF